MTGVIQRQFPLEIRRPAQESVIEENDFRHLCLAVRRWPGVSRIDDPIRQGDVTIGTTRVKIGASCSPPLEDRHPLAKSLVE
jgi:hypothetical protein